MAAILDDPEASRNDRGVAIAMLKNAAVASDFILPLCQDTGTATIIGKKGQQVWTGVKDEEYLARGIYETFARENLRYSQTVPLSMYEEKNSGTNLPAQIGPRRSRDGGAATRRLEVRRTSSSLRTILPCAVHPYGRCVTLGRPDVGLARRRAHAPRTGGRALGNLSYGKKTTLAELCQRGSGTNRWDSSFGDRSGSGDKGG